MCIIFSFGLICFFPLLDFIDLLEQNKLSSLVQFWSRVWSTEGVAFVRFLWRSVWSWSQRDFHRVLGEETQGGRAQWPAEGAASAGQVWDNVFYIEL